MHDLEMKRMIIKDAHMGVLEKIVAGETLNWLDRSVLNALLEGQIETCQEVSLLVQQINASQNLKRLI